MPELTQELIDEIAENPDKIDSLDMDLKRKVTDHLTSGKMDFGSHEEEPTKEKVDEKPEEKQEEKPKEEAPKPEPEWKKRIREAKEKEQENAEIAENLRKRKEKLTKEYQESIKDLKPDEDIVYDEDFAKQMWETNQKLAKKIELLEKSMTEADLEEAEKFTRKSKEAQQMGVLYEIEDLQNEYPEQLKTKNSFERLNSDYSRYLDSLVKVAGLDSDQEMSKKQKRDMAYQMYEEDPLFRKKVKEAEVELPESLKDEEEFKKYEFITNLYNQKHTNGGSLKGNFLEHLDSQGKLDEILQRVKKEAAIEASKKTLDSMEGTGVSEPSASDGAGKTEYTKPMEDEGTLLQKLDLLQSKVREGGRLSQEESKELNQIISALTTGEKG